MQKKTKNLFIILCLSILLSGIMVLLCFIDPKPFSSDKILSTILLSIWTFSLIPAYVFIYNYLKSKTFSEGFVIGSHLGRAFGFTWFLIPLIIGPFLMVMFYITLLNHRA